jgi:site-specific recombinase XerD
MEIQNVVSAYIAVLKIGDKSENTIRSYTKDIQKFINHFEIKDTSEIEEISVDKYHNFYGSLGLSNVSLNGLIRNLSAFFAYLKEGKYVSNECPFFFVKFGKTKFVDVKRKFKDILSPDEEELVINAGRNLQEKFMLAMALKTALRRSEIAGIKMSDISGCEITITGKGGDEAKTYLNDRLCAMLQEYVLKERNTDSEYLFYGTRGKQSVSMTGDTVNNRVKDACERAGIEKKITAHRLRATRITNVAYEHGDRAAQAIARHKSHTTTELYIGKNDMAVKNIMLSEN